MKIILKNTILKAVLLTTILVSALSCDKHEALEVDQTALKDLSGDWYVRLFINNEEALEYSLITTTNSADVNSLWIDDHHHIWDFKVVCPADGENLSFSGANLPSNVDGYEVDINITNGLIIKEGTIAPGGSVVDSIYFEAEFSDDLNPGTIYQLAGYRRTGLAADEH
ncbi:hypothetical protein F8C76_10100 [Flagellimonas olearia]|uniref:Lipid-binding hydrolase n=1 Tax=Flagellimonas olearia TaxID=552546 RepID=A0A6I1DU44_9FLAO|nr:lipid-binding protein [Allomuricauda olearia]KAB7528215.1 hypothetical protein F8C76_10100 [Allomuricauda olearia]